MPITYSLTTAPVDTLVTLEQAKTHLYVDHNDDNSYIQILINLAERTVEVFTELYLGTQTFTLFLDTFPVGRTAQGEPVAMIQILRNPVQSITTVKYIDTDGTQQTLADTEYQIDKESQPARLVPSFGNSWPSTQASLNAVEIEFIAGYASIDEMNARRPMMVHAVKLLIGEWYENREASQDIDLKDIPHGVKMLLGTSGLHTYT